MTALVQAISRLSASANIETETTLKMLAILSGSGRCLSLFCATYGLDLGAEFF